MKNIVAFAVKFPITIIMMVCGVLLLGIISFDNLGIDLFPNLNSPRLFVEIKAGERPPEEIEKQFIEGIESLAIRQKGVTQVSSISKAGSGRITVQYSWDKDMDQAFLELQKSLTSYSQNSDIEELTITQHDPNATPVMIIGLYHPNVDDFNELRKTAENYIRNELIRLEGIADVKLAGQLEEEIVIDTDPFLLESYGLSVDQLVGKIQSYNRSVSGGSIEELGKKYIIKGTSIVSNADDLEEIVVGYTTKSNGEQSPAAVQQNQEQQNQSNFNKVPILLREVARVSVKDKDANNIVRINQTRSLGLSVYKETKFNTVKAVEELETALKEIEKALPGYQFVIVQNQGNFILQAINEVEESGLLGALFAIIVLFVFLRRVGTTFIISVAIPVSIVATFNLMYFNDLSLNVMTLGGLALGAGMLVDNAIVVMENIFRNLESGLSIKEAAIKGTSEVSGAITASTITTIIVFLPIVYVHGASGELFKDQAWTVAFSLISSLVVAILVIPMLFTRVFKASSSTTKKKSIEFKGYGNFLQRILKLRVIVIFLAAVAVGTAYYLLSVIGSEYMPKADTRAIAIDIELPEGTKLERTHNTVKQIEHQVYTLFDEHIKNVYSHIGTNEDETAVAENSFEDEHTANIKIIFKEDSPIGSQKAITALGTFLQSVPELKVHFSEDESALQTIIGTEEAPLVVEVKGRDFKEIETILNQVEEHMLSNTDFFNIKSSMEDRMTQIEVKVDKYMAGLHNITTESITNQVKDQLSGKDAGQLEKGGEMQDILIKIPEVALGQLDNITLKNGTQSLRLDEVAKVQTILAPSAIQRRNQNRVGTIAAQVNDEKPFDRIVKDLETDLAGIVLPPNYRIEVIGEELKRKESVQNLTFALLLSIVLVYMVLASQFESLLHPFTILLTIPLAGVGAVLIFFFLGQPLNIMAYIGIIMLTGIAVNDSIILVDAINRNKVSGMPLVDAIVKAGQQRIRPIIMTSLTTILALLPLTFGFGESVSLRSPMAYAVIGGLVTSTLLTLVIIPCVYMVLDQLFTRSGSEVSGLSS
ncbi:efflux RND transporter permease subunit [Fulvivirgaceae bacterium BMA10]|uniref:Efflux RND transporter permease subunit n=1 Tax=Splendidivirga corallicola TaxID=3051826 RepID=A0ABT8KQ34_9BACT|nr:efflux RND transporter permease subunit [Fulvivirgaceae bacterium BMA10]